MNIVGAARIWQIRATAAGIRWLSRLSAGRRLLRSIRGSSIAAPALQALLGYRGSFPTLRQAQAAVERYANGGHVYPANGAWHIAAAEQPRPSDYAAMFHLLPVLPSIGRVFDVGGNLGNLFYLYTRYVSFRPDLSWSVYDLPEHLTRGAALALERGAAQLNFTDGWGGASGADLLIASGSLHYFPTPLPRMLAELAALPRYVLINRTPLTNGPTVATVQDAGQFRVACMLFNRDELLAGFEQLGYRTVDAWSATELSMEIPGHEAHRVRAYSGFFFQRV